MSVSMIDPIGAASRLRADFASPYAYEQFWGGQQMSSNPMSLIQNLMAVVLMALQQAANMVNPTGGGQNGSQGNGGSGGSPFGGGVGGGSPFGDGGSPFGGRGSWPGLGGAGDPWSSGYSRPPSFLDMLGSLFENLGALFDPQGVKPNGRAGLVADRLGRDCGYGHGPAWNRYGGDAGNIKPTEIPPAKGEVTVNKPIVVKAGETFDGGGKVFKAGSSLGDGGQSENQKPVFILEPGAKLQNVQVEGGDGVHTYGDATLNNVWWRDVGEDAMTMKKPGNVQVNGGGAYNATDKIFQVNAGGSLSVNGFTADTFGKAVRTNGGHDFPIDISIRNSVFRNGDEAVVRTDAKQARIFLDNVQFDTKNDVLAPTGVPVTGATARGQKEYVPD